MAKHIIGLHGGSGVGKSITARLLQHELPNYRIIAFGDIIKRIAEALYHIPLHKWENRNFKTMHRDKLEMVGRMVALLDGGYAVINATLDGLEDNCIISDVRTKREVEIVRGMNGIVVKVIRDVNEVDNIIETVSVSDLDYVLDNTKDVEHLEKNIQSMLEYFKLK